MLGVPTIIDHDNDDFTLWESTTIVRYLVERYDKDHKISFPSGTNESFLIDQWMTFQASGQVSADSSDDLSVPCLTIPGPIQLDSILWPDRLVQTSTSGEDTKRNRKIPK